MEYAIVIIAVVAVIATGVIIYMKKNKKDSPTPAAGVTEQIAQSADLIVTNTKRDELIIPIEMLPVVWVANEAAKRGSQILKVGLDEYRFMLMKDALLSINFSPEKGWENVIKIRPSDEMKRIPVITSGFIQKRFAFGDVPVLRWAIQNSMLAANAHGNYTYEKIEPKSRKTDPFKAFVAAECVSDVLDEYAYQADMPEVSTFTF